MLEPRSVLAGTGYTVKESFKIEERDLEYFLVGSL